MMSSNNNSSSNYNLQSAYNSKITGQNEVEDGSSSTETLSAEERHTLTHTQREEPQGEEQVYAHAVSSINVPSPIINTAMSHLSGTPDLSTSTSTAAASRNNDSNLSMSSNTNTLIIHHSVPDESWSHRWLSGYTSSTKSLRERSLQPSDSDPVAPFVTRVATGKLSEPLASSTAFLGGGTFVLSSSSFLDAASSNLGVPSGLAGGKASSYFPATSSAAYAARMRSSHYSNPTEILDIPSSYLDQSEVLKHLITKETKDHPGSATTAAAAAGVSRGLLVNGLGVSSYAGVMSSGFSDQSTSSSSSALNALHADRGSVSGSSSQGSQQMSGIDRDDPDLSALLHRLPPPPAYPAWQLDCSSDSKDATGGDTRPDRSLLLSKSQPDLTRVGAIKETTPAKESLTARFSSVLLQDEDIPSTLKEYVDILTHENSTLKLEADIYHRKVAKLQRFELEMAKVEEQYEALVKLCERREQLERLARHKLHSEVRRLSERNNDLKEQLESAGGQSLINQSSSLEGLSDAAAALKKELNKRDVFIAQLISQNKELVATKERQEMELTAQRQTLNEQRTHIDILDSALTNAQTNVVKLEEEVRKKQNLVEQAGQLKRLLLSIKLAADRREQSEKNLRQKLEMEILQLRSNTKVDQTSSEIAVLRRELREKEEKIMMLEGEVTKWEQRFLQESAMRQVAIEAASMPKDAKIAALEKNTQDSERKIAQAKSDKLRHLDEIHAITKKIAILESRNRTLESQNAEREAMIRALQKRAEEKEIVFQTTQASSGASNKSESTTTSQSGVQGSPKHQHSTSGVPPLSVFAAPPRKDEELGHNNQVHSPLSSYYQSQSSYPSHYPVELSSKIPQDFQPKPSQEMHTRLPQEAQTHTRSESYCCYVNSYEHGDVDPHVSETATDVASVYVKESRSAEDDSRSPEKKHVIAHARPYDPSQSFRSGQVQGKHLGMTPNHGSSVVLLNPQVSTQPLNGVSKSPSPSVSANVIEIQTSRGEPPPYYSQHQVLKLSPTEPPLSPVQKSQAAHVPQIHPPPQSQQQPCPPPLTAVQLNCPAQSVSHPATLSSPVPQTQSPPLPRPVVVCQRPHPPNVFCRTCLNVRRSHRQNAAALVRRANSSGCQHNRRSAPSPASSADSLDDAPSILERLKKEWEMGVLGPPVNKRDTARQSDHALKKASGSKTLPHPLGESLSVAPDDGRRQESDSPSFASAAAEAAPEAGLGGEKEGSESGGKKDVAHLDRALNRLSMKRGSNPQHHAKHLIKSTNLEAAVPLSASHPHSESGQRYNSSQEPTSRNNSYQECGNVETSRSITTSASGLDVSSHPQQYLERNVKNQVQPHPGVNLQLQSQQSKVFSADNRNDQCIELMILEDTDQLKENKDNWSQVPSHNQKLS